MTIGTKLYTYFHGKHVGTDEFGNRYFMEKKEPKAGRRKRWVMYKGKAEASKVPPHWHGWLHYTTDALPESGKPVQYEWQKEHLPNLTGTTGAYMPPGHLLKGGVRDKTTADYQPWTPK